jgi:hypothetical protein
LAAGEGPHPLRQFIHVLGFRFHINVHKKEKVLVFHRKLWDEKLPLMNVIDDEDYRRSGTPGAKDVSELGIAAPTKNDVGHNTKITVHKTSLFSL